MIPKILHRTAKSKFLTWEERHLARRAASILPGWQMHLWDDSDNDALIAKHFPEHLKLYRGLQRGVMKADIARLVYMHAFGGVYMDTDYKLVRALDADLLNQRCILGLETDVPDGDTGEWRKTHKIGNAFFAAERGYPLFTDMVHDIFSRVPSGRLSELELMQISGPHGLSRFLQGSHARYNGLVIKPQSVFFPVARAKGLLAAQDKSTIGVHLCWGSWRDKRRSVTIKNRMRRLLSAVL